MVGVEGALYDVHLAPPVGGTARITFRHRTAGWSVFTYAESDARLDRLTPAELADLLAEAMARRGFRR